MTAYVEPDGEPIHWSDSLGDLLAWNEPTRKYTGFYGQLYDQLPEDHEPLYEIEDVQRRADELRARPLDMRDAARALQHQAQEQGIPFRIVEESADGDTYSFTVEWTE